MSDPQSTVLDLFCGAAGGWSLGLHQAGYRTVAAAESDPWRRATFLRKFADVEMFEDVRAVTAGSLRERLGYLPRVVVGSPPCQDASSANHYGAGLDGHRTGLFAEFVRIVGEVRPAWFAAENVFGLSYRGLDRLLGELDGKGYHVWPLGMGADDFGAPHPRERIWLVGVDSDQEDEPGEPEHGEVAGLVGPHPWSEPWPEAAPRFHALADGLPAGLAGRWASALGDAVCPAITRAIGLCMRLEAA